MLHVLVAGITSSVDRWFCQQSPCHQLLSFLWQIFIWKNFFKPVFCMFPVLTIMTGLWESEVDGWIWILSAHLNVKKWFLECDPSVCLCMPFWTVKFYFYSVFRSYPLDDGALWIWIFWHQKYQPFIWAPKYNMAVFLETALIILIKNL